MPYVDVYKGQRETGRMLECKHEIDGVIHDLGDYPETENIISVEWQTPWQPDHAPVGSVVEYASGNYCSAVQELNQATVTGHQWNGVRSWVILTDDVCPIRGGEYKASFNGDHLRRVISRGKGGVQWTKALYEDSHKKEYLADLSRLPVGLKKPHEYAGASVERLIAYLMESHPALSRYRNAQHVLCAADLIPAVKDLFTVIWPNQWQSYYTVSKKKLIKRLIRAIPRFYQNKDKLEKEEAAFYAELDRDMDLLDEE